MITSIRDFVGALRTTVCELNCFLTRVWITATEAIRTRPKRTADTEEEEVNLEDPGDRRRLTNMGELTLCAATLNTCRRQLRCVRRDAEYSFARLVKFSVTWKRSLQLTSHRSCRHPNTQGSLL